MKSKLLKWSLFVSAIALFAFVGINLSTSDGEALSSSNTIAFGARPAFAEAQGRLRDVGISAYIDTGVTIDLEDVRGSFEAIEDETNDYIIGLVSVPGYGDEQDEVFHTHVYISTDGWLLAYYMDSDPASKIMDWKGYVNSGGTSLPTLLEHVLVEIAGDAGVPYELPSYYDFRFPNATHLMFVADFTEPRDYDYFSIELPTGLTYYETSWGLYRNAGCCVGPYWNIDGTTVAGSNTIFDNFIGWGTVQVSPNTEHLIEANYVFGLAVVYREQ